MKIRSNYKARPVAVGEVNSGEYLVDPTNFVPLDDVIRRSLRGEQLPIYHRGYANVSQDEDISRDVTDVTEAHWARRSVAKKEHAVPMDIPNDQAPPSLDVNDNNNNTAGA